MANDQELWELLFETSEGHGLPSPAVLLSILLKLCRLSYHEGEQFLHQTLHSQFHYMEIYNQKHIIPKSPAPIYVKPDRHSTLAGQRGYYACKCHLVKILE